MIPSGLGWGKSTIAVCLTPHPIPLLTPIYQGLASQTRVESHPSADQLAVTKGCFFSTASRLLMMRSSLPPHRRFGCTHGPGPFGPGPPSIVARNSCLTSTSSGSVVTWRCIVTLTNNMIHIPTNMKKHPASSVSCFRVLATMKPRRHPRARWKKVATLSMMMGGWSGV